MENKTKDKKPLLACLLLAMFFTCSAIVSAVEPLPPILAVYITGIGCPNCAITDPVVLNQYTADYPNLIIVEYEIYELRDDNQGIANNYFEYYLPGTRAGVPLIIFNKNQTGLGRFQVLDSKEIIKSLDYNEFPLDDGSSVSFEGLDLVSLPGRVKIWAKNRVLSSLKTGGDNQLLKELLITDNIPLLLNGNSDILINPLPVAVSGGSIDFDNAAELDGWILQWNNVQLNTTNATSNLAVAEEVVEELNKEPKSFWGYWYVYIGVFLLLVFLLLFFKQTASSITRKGIQLSETQKNYLIIGISLLFLLGFFILAKNVPPDLLQHLGYSLPLPLFTVFIALIDGFNPCNLFVLTVLLGLLVSASHSRKKIYAVGYTFIFVVFVIYFFFMAAWLNIFKYLGFVTPLRIAIALIALVAGFINCKELVAFRKGVTLMIQEQHKGPLMKKIESMKELIKNGSLPTLIFASISLAAFASLVELPCTAGFPIIYTGILTGKLLGSGFSYYLYLAFYNLIYVTPLIVIITIFGYTFEGKQITKRQMQIIKFIGGLIMILLGLILLINPSLIGISLG